jgi:hypothetical protein
MIHFTATILVPNLITSSECGRRLFSLFMKYFPKHVPERVGESEPLIRHFDLQDLGSVLEAWGHTGFIAESSNPVSVLQVRFCPPVSRNPRHSSISLLQFQSEEVLDSEKVLGFVFEVSENFSADYASAHILTRTELENRMAMIESRPAAPPQASGKQTVVHLRKRIEKEGFAAVLTSMRNGNHTVGLRRCLPGLSWLTVFGAAYVQLFGRKKLLSAPAIGVRELSNGAIGIRLTERLNDSQDDWDRFEIVRKRCEQFLDSAAFFDPSLPSNHAYRVPTFRFAEITRLTY